MSTRKYAGPVVNGEQFASGYTPAAAAYEQRTRTVAPIDQAKAAHRPSQHTPGPWYVTSGGYIGSKHDGYVPLRSPFRTDAFVDGPEHSDPTEATLAANARLIAAAPALLAACEALMVRFEATGEAWMHDPAMVQARAAIAAATTTASQGS